MELIGENESKNDPGKEWPAKCEDELVTPMLEKSERSFEEKHVKC